MVQFKCLTNFPVPFPRRLNDRRGTECLLNGLQTTHFPTFVEFLLLPEIDIKKLVP